MPKTPSLLPVFAMLFAVYAHASTITLSLPSASLIADVGSTGISTGGTPSPALYLVFGSAPNEAIATAGIAGPVASASALGSGSAVSSLHYNLEIVGPSSTEVPLIISGQTSAILGMFSDSTVSAVANVMIKDQSQTLLNLSDCIGYGCPSITTDPGLFVSAGSFLFTTSTLANNMLSIDLSAGVAAGGDSGNAVADPYFQIDPTFLAANPGYSLVFSPGVTNQQSSTPEPGTFFSVACCAVLLVLRKYRLNRA